MKKLFLFMLLSALVVLSTLFFAGCDRAELGKAPVPDNYEQIINEWKQNRVETLKAPTGWLRLAGMFILEEGENTFGSGEDVDVRFPENKIGRYAGAFILDDGKVKMELQDDIEITHNSEQVSSGKIIYDEESAPELEHGDLQWFVIQRQDLFAIRLFNKDNEKADEFTGFPRYETNENWRLKARFKPNPEGSQITILNVLDQAEPIDSPGVLEFEVDGERFTLDALSSAGGRLFLIVGDETNRSETYQAGRYMYIDPPEEGSNYTVIDFNKIYNPPCAYNTHTTCQLPPPQNRLELAITAGEKRPIDWEGL